MYFRLKSEVFECRLSFFEICLLQESSFEDPCILWPVEEGDVLFPVARPKLNTFLAWGLSWLCSKLLEDRFPLQILTVVDDVEPTL